MDEKPKQAAAMKDFVVGMERCNESQRPGAGSAWTDYKGETRCNDTHGSTTDAEAKLIRKGPDKDAPLRFADHTTMENRHDLGGVGAVPILAPVNRVIEHVSQ